MTSRTNVHRELANVRETFESIWVAIILAFVLRAFIIEAFVIPTGSMAPRLMGQHQLLDCPSCGYEFPFGVDSSVSGFSRGSNTPAFCPNCSEKIDTAFKQAPPQSGDRVLVLKYLYKFRQPDRWDVVVFKNPQSNRDNYIKRLAGLPGEMVRIIHGDLFTAKVQDVNGDGNIDDKDLDFNHDGVFTAEDLETVQGQALPWQVARKTQQNQEVMWQLLFDTDYQPNLRPRTDWKNPWEVRGGAPEQWQLTLSEGRVFHYQGDAPATADFAQGDSTAFLATNAYNSRQADGSVNHNTDICNDLKLQTVLAPASAAGVLKLSLTAFNDQFDARIGFDGTLQLLRRRVDEAGKTLLVWETSKTIPPLQVGRAVPVALTHVDWKVTLWIDGEPVLQTTDKDYAPDVPELVQLMHVNTRLLPVPSVSITGESGAFDLWHTKVMRDVFYTCPNLMGQSVPPEALSATPEQLADWSSKALAKAREGKPAPLTAMPGWGTMDRPLLLRKYKDNPDLDEFFMLGDNSPASLDSRLWVKAAATLRLTDAQGNAQYRMGTVPRYNMMGRAFFVYWPAGHPLPGLRLPLVPNVGKMRGIH